MSNPRILFYLANNQKENINLNDDQLFEKEYHKAMNDQWQYHNDWGHQGFLSEKSYPENFDEKAIRIARGIVKNRDIKLEIRKVAVDDESCEVIVSGIEAISGFKRWIKQPQPSEGILR